MSRTYLTLTDVLLIHHTAIVLSGGSPGIRDAGLLESAVFRPQSGYYDDLFGEAAALFESLVQNHAFVDANKRTAFIAADVFLRANGFRISVNAADAERFILENLEKRSLKYERILAWLKQNTRPL